MPQKLINKALVLDVSQADEAEVYRAVSGYLSASAAVSWPTKLQGDLGDKTAAAEKHNGKLLTT